MLITELAKAVSYDENGPLVAEITPDHILKICSNFLLADTSQVVQFCHLSAREFLEKRQTNSILDYSCDLAHAQAAISSLALLNRNDIIISPTPELNFTQKPGNFVPKRNFSEYARDFVMFHIKMSGENRKQHPLESMLQSFFSRRPLEARSPFLNWSNGLSPNTSYDLLRYQSEPPNPLFMVCEWGFANVFETISGNVDFNLEQLNAAGISPLYLACRRGHYDVVLLLLEYGADIDATSHHPPRSALHAAAKSGHYEIVSLLLQRGASVVGDPSRTSPLAAAAKEGHFAIFKLLFELGADRGDYKSAFVDAILLIYNH